VKIILALFMHYHNLSGMWRECYPR